MKWAKFERRRIITPSLTRGNFNSLFKTSFCIIASADSHSHHPSTSLRCWLVCSIWWDKKELKLNRELLNSPFFIVSSLARLAISITPSTSLQCRSAYDICCNKKELNLKREYYFFTDLFNCFFALSLAWLAISTPPNTSWSAYDICYNKKELSFFTYLVCIVVNASTTESSTDMNSLISTSTIYVLLLRCRPSSSGCLQCFSVCCFQWCVVFLSLVYIIHNAAILSGDFQLNTFNFHRNM